MTLTTPLTLQGLKDRVSEAASFIVEADDKEKYVWSRLEKLGIYQDEMSCELLQSPDCTEGDARRVFCENGEPNQPVPRFRRVWRILKGMEEPERLDYHKLQAGLPDFERLADALKPIGQSSDKELLESYELGCPDDVIAELNKRSKGRNFVAFSDVSKGIVDKEVTLRMLREARRRKMPIHHSAKDCLYELFRAGDFPGETFMECPFHPGEFLLDGYCDKCEHSWEGVDYEAMQLARLIKNRREEPSDPFTRKQFISNARDGIKSVKEDYPKAGVDFESRKDEGTLPVLKKRNKQEAQKSGGSWGTTVNIHD